jgi:PilZ domain
MHDGHGVRFALHPNDPEPSFGPVVTPGIVSHLALQEKAALSERRRHQRHAVACRCWLEADQLTLCAPTVDVATGGLFLRTAVPLSTGACVDVALQVTGSNAQLRALARITRSISARSGARHGVGVEFLQIHAGEDALATWLVQQAPLAWVR